MNNKKAMLNGTSFPAQGRCLTFAFHFLEREQPKRKVKSYLTPEALQIFQALTGSARV